MHSELPSRTAIWTYHASPDTPPDPQPPVGPTIEVQQGQRTHIAWVNALTNPDGSFARHPVAAVCDLPAVVQLAHSGIVHAPQNLPGFTLGHYDWLAGQVPPWTVVHLHGGRTAADADGWPESGCYPCHILEHQDHEMMRPLVVMPPEVIDHMHAVGASQIAPSAEPSSGWYMDMGGHGDSMEGMIG